MEENKPTVTIDLYDYDQLSLKEQRHNMLVEALCRAIKKPYPSADHVDLEFTDDLRFMLEMCAPGRYKQAVAAALNGKEAN